MVLEVEKERLGVARGMDERKEVDGVADRALEEELDAGAQMRLARSCVGARFRFGSVVAQTNVRNPNPCRLPP